MPDRVLAQQPTRVVGMGFPDAFYDRQGAIVAGLPQVQTEEVIEWHGFSSGTAVGRRHSWPPGCRRRRTRRRWCPQSCTDTPAGTSVLPAPGVLPPGSLPVCAGTV